MGEELAVLEPAREGGSEGAQIEVTRASRRLSSEIWNAVSGQLGRYPIHTPPRQRRISGLPLLLRAQLRRSKDLFDLGAVASLQIKARVAD